MLAAVLATLALVAAVALLPPLAEPESFRIYVDERAFLGIPNFLNVVSNLPLSLVGAAGLAFLARGGARGAFSDPREAWTYGVCFLGVALAGIGSAYYHWLPDAGRLMWDRLPIALGFMALLAAVIADRIDATLGLRLLAPLLAAGAASVLYWRWSALQGRENILPYAIVQYGAIAAILALAALRPSRYPRGADLFGVVAFYALAKAAEMLDRPVYALGEVVSGHTLKHLLAALAVYWVLRMLRRRGA